MPINVFRMDGNPLMNAKDVLYNFAERDDIKHVVIIAMRDDDISEIAFDAQQYSDIILAAAQLNSAAMDMARETVEKQE